MRIIQCKLASKDSTMIAWLDSRPDLAVGKWVTLKDSEDPARRWEVLSVGITEMDKDEVSQKTRGAFFGRDMHRRGNSWVECK
mgnify:CR=1 FL=1